MKTFIISVCRNGSTRRITAFGKDRFAAIIAITTNLPGLVCEYRISAEEVVA